MKNICLEATKALQAFIFHYSLHVWSESIIIDLALYAYIFHYSFFIIHSP